MIRKIFTYPSDILYKKALRVERVDDEVRALLADMVDTLYSTESGIGLAAPQVGVSLRVIVVDDREGNLLHLINPEIVSRSGETSSEEGCLSVPGLCVSIDRSEEITVKYMDISGEEKMLDAKGFLAIVIQHECDHLDGVLIIDHVGQIQRGLYEKRLKKECRKL
ncbi:MAG: peptide deformylase [Pseudomonadota bacterium]